MNRTQSCLGLAMGLGIYGLLAFCTVRDVGVVGEVAAGWLPEPPQVAVSMATDGVVWSQPPAEPHAGSVWGPLLAAQTRPLERLHVGRLDLPLALNTYTGAVPDWPARVVFGLFRDPRAVVGLHVGMGALLILALHRFLGRFGQGDGSGSLAATVSVAVLATDWSFLFYRKVLSGTEIALLAGSLLVVWGLWIRRWGSGSRHRGDLFLALGTGLGLMAKITFLPSLLALGIAAFLTRRDRPSHEPPVRAGLVLGVVSLCLLPLGLALVHRVVGVPVDPRIVSHDDLGLQWARIGWGWSSLADAPAREGLANLGYFLFEPLGWFRAAYGASLGSGTLETGCILRLLGACVLLLGIGQAWRHRQGAGGVSPPDASATALLRFLSIALPLQILFIQLGNRDLHHLGQVSVLWAATVGLAVQEATASIRRPFMAIFLAFPLVLAGILSLRGTDPLLKTIRTPVFTEEGQQALVSLVRAAGVRHLWTSDYDLYGVFEARAPDLDVRHAWGAVSRADSVDDLLIPMLRASAGGDWLLVRPSAPMIYNYLPSMVRIQAMAPAAGVRVKKMAQLDDSHGTWAWLIRVDSQPQPSPSHSLPGIVVP